MEHNYIFWGVVGIISGLVAALADVPLVKPGRPEPSTASLKGKIQTWWADVPSKRFVISFWLSFLGQPGTYISEDMLNIARKKLGNKAELTVAHAENIPFGSDFFDAIITTDTCYFWKEPRKVLMEIEWKRSSNLINQIYLQ